MVNNKSKFDDKPYDGPKCVTDKRSKCVDTPTVEPVHSTYWPNDRWVIRLIGVFDDLIYSIQNPKTKKFWWQTTIRSRRSIYNRFNYQLCMYKFLYGLLTGSICFIKYSHLVTKWEVLFIDQSGLLNPTCPKGSLNDNKIQQHFCWPNDQNTKTNKCICNGQSALWSKLFKRSVDQMTVFIIDW